MQRRGASCYMHRAAYAELNCLEYYSMYVCILDLIPNMLNRI